MVKCPKILRPHSGQIYDVILARHSYRVKTTDSNHSGPIAPHLLRDRPKPEQPNQIWRSDITYVQTGESWLYLCAFKDAYSRRQVGWAMSDKIDTTLVLNALNMALHQRRPPPGLIIHTDRGCQYASEAYRTAIAKAGAIPSMSRRANCYDNAAMECKRPAEDPIGAEGGKS